VNEFDRLTQQMSRLFDERRTVLPAVLPAEGFTRFDLPDVDRDSIELTAEKNVLTVRAERNWTPGEGQEVVVAERPQGNFTRQLFLGESFDVDHITATYDQGVLTVVVPVVEQAKPRRVEIAEGSSSADGTNTVEGTTTNPAVSSPA
jgi:HSP20 family protein